MQTLADALEKGDEEAFTTAVAEYDSLSRLDPWKTSMLVRRVWCMAAVAQLLWHVGAGSCPPLTPASSPAPSAAGEAQDHVERGGCGGGGSDVIAPAAHHSSALLPAYSALNM